MRKVTLAAVGVLAFVLLPALPAAAHPLGNFTVNRYDGLLLTPKGVQVDHVVDLAEIPTVQVRRSVDADDDGRLAADERRAWARQRCTDEMSRLRLKADGSALAMRLAGATARAVPGQGGLLTLRVECDLRAPLKVSTATAVTFTDAGREQVGWREITVRGNGATVVRAGGSAIRERSVSNRLSAYPDDLLSAPLDDRSVAFQVQPGGATVVEPVATEGVLARPTDRLGEAFTGLVGGRELGLGAGILAVGLALVIGAMHAVAPGHGKTIMAFYLVGRGQRRARAARDAMTVGATVTLTHTAGVLVLGMLVAGTATVAPASAYPWLGAASGLVIAVVGVGLLRAALRRRRGGHDGGHDHVFGPDGTHSHGVGRRHSHGPRHRHSHEHSHGAGSHEHAHGAGSHEHVHDDGGHDHALSEPVGGDDHGHPHVGSPPAQHRHLDRPALAVAQRSPAGSTALLVATPAVQTLPAPPEVVPSRGLEEHTAHARDEQVSSRRGRAGLVAVGIAGGLVPSPSALVVLLGAAAVGRAWFGVLLVLAFGLGMAVTLSATGLLLVLAQDKLERMPKLRWLPAMRRPLGLLPLVSAAAVCVLGVFLVVRALSTLQ